MEHAVGFQDAIAFGPFNLVASARLLMKEGVPVELGARTLDTLIALVSCPNEVVGKKDLLARVWPDVIVEEGSLRFHIAELRKILGDGKGGARYIATLPGRGYCFVAPISRLEIPGNSVKLVTGASSRTYLPGRLLRMVGRADSIASLTTLLETSRFVTIVGSGGVGKTTVAVAVAYDLLEAFAGSVLFVDLGVLDDSDIVTAAIASMLGLPVQSNGSVSGLVEFLRGKRMLLILDNCEHVIEAVAVLTAELFVAAPQIHILATSREALRVEGEQVYKLAPLAFPPEHPMPTAAVALTFPATQLFVERVAAVGTRLDLNDLDAAIVARICRKLDGVPLAIELAAGRVEAYGLKQTADLLDQRLNLLWQGQRTAAPRQQTLQATLDWSYELLSELERVVLRRLAVFVGHFTIEAAVAVVTGEKVDQSSLFGAIDSLVAKSMVAPWPVGAMMRYRLLESTRAYALETIADDAELAGLAKRHANYYRLWLEQDGAEWPTISNATERAPHFAALSNVRAALEWCFGRNGNAQIGVQLAAAAAPVFLAMSLLTECHRWSERAILALDETALGGSEEMRLQTALGLSLMFTRGNGEAVSIALHRALAIAEQCGDAPSQLELLGRLHMFHHRGGDQNLALQYAERSSAVSNIIGDPAAVALAHSLLGISFSYMGELGNARSELEAALQHDPGSQRTGTIFQGVVHYIIAGAYLGRTLWLQGHPIQAVRRARQTVSDAASMDHPVTLCIALLWAVSVALWIGDLEDAEENIDRFIANAKSHSLTPYLLVGRAVKAELAIRRGDAKGGIGNLQNCIKELHAIRFELLITRFNISMVQGLAAIERFGESKALIDETIGRVEVNGDLSYMPELLRVKGNVLLSMSQPMMDEAESCFRRSLEWSRRQNALAWELRTAIDLAALLAAQGRHDDARALLQPVLKQFVEGRDTADLKAAEYLLETLD